MTANFPRRIVHPCPPGHLLKRASIQPPVRREVTGRDLGYLALVRQLPCLHCGDDPCGEAAHVRMASAAFGKASGMQKKPDDKWALPLCASDHRLAKHAQHNRNEAAFWADLGINALLTCTRLNAVAGDLVAMRAVIFVTISERGR